MGLSEVERKTLTRVVGRCRTMLEGEVRDQFERIHGFMREGAPRPLEGLLLSSVEQGVTEELREWHRHLVGMATGTIAARQQAAMNRMAEETVFTVLHRLAALRMAEERGVIQPCIRDGLRSDGFRLYLQFAGGALGRDEEAYRIFLERVFDEIAEDLPALFDRREPRSLVFPQPSCLEAVVRELTCPDLGRAWEDDETIGWVYQDFHSAEERREIRRGNDVPRDGVDLAIRNQLFTPRWVVEFLTDNTLGRLWVEMTSGETAVAERCAYLLGGEVTSHVTPKDPRDLRVLDPACGSGHFLLYAFDLLETIYLEAWDRRVGGSPDRRPVWIEYPDRAAFERVVPALILRHNLFGVDIDPRPIQVAALALWLRAQRSWRGIRYAERPRIERMNLVCAEPMPGDAAELDAFAAELRPAVLGDLVREVWQAMRPVGETGLLLRIDDEIRSIVGTARERWNGTNGPAQPQLFAETPNWSGRRHDLRDLARDEAARFWSEAEERVVQALQSYAAQAGEHDRVLRRLFAEDAERGFAFIDLSRARYDVVLMNPPFGQPADGTKDALDAAYPACGHEIYAMFFERALELLEPDGRVGAITNRTWLALKWLRGLRENVFGERGAVTLGADLGSFVLEAQVETCAVVVDRRATADTTATWVRLLKTRRKDGVLYDALRAAAEGRDHPYVYRSAARRFRRVPEGVYAYWMSDALLDRCATSPTIQAAISEVKQGTATAKDFRFLRLAWEVDAARIGLDAKWPRFAKGGEYRPFWDDIHLLLNWENSGAEVIALGRGRPQGIDYFGDRGVTWPRRTTSDFGPRVFNAGCAYADKGPTAFPRLAFEAPRLLAVLASASERLLLSTRLAAGDDRPGSAAKSYEVGVVKELPWPSPAEAQGARLEALANAAVTLVRDGQLEDDPTGETCVAFSIPPVLRTGRDLPIVRAARRRVEAREDRFAEQSDITAAIDDIVADAYGFTERDRRLMDEELERAVARYTEPAADPDDELFRTAYLTKDALPGDRLPGGLDAEVDVRVEHRRGRQHAALRDEEALCRLFEIPPPRLATVRKRLDLLRTDDLRRVAADVVSWAVGVVFGRWDVRLLNHPEWMPDWPDPFGPLPRCPLGQLVDGRGLPATREHIASDAWLAARNDATRLPTVEAGAGGTLVLLDADGRPLGSAEVDASQYPLTVAWDGLLQDEALDDDAPSRHADDLYRRVSQVLEHVYGAAHAEREAELAQALGVASLREWIRHSDGFFADHLARYSKSRRRAPIYWPLSTTSGGFTLWLYYPRISGAMLAACVNRMRAGDVALKREEDRLLAARRAGALPAGGQERLDRHESERRERAELREALRELVDRNFQPHLDDGAVVNAAPLAAWFRNRAWREVAEQMWGDLQQGEHDWSRLAFWLRGDEVLARCRTERDLAIAHGREDVYAPSANTAASRGRGRRRPTQIALRNTEEGDDG
jgi:hypothetical protein